MKTLVLYFNILMIIILLSLFGWIFRSDGDVQLSTWQYFLTIATIGMNTVYLFRSDERMKKCEKPQVLQMRKF